MIILLGLLGLCVGSFLNVLVWRLNVDSAPKFWRGRSICPNCRHKLAWVDNIPLLSFIFLKGKCRYCHKTISWQYPAVELITALTFVLIGWNIFFLLFACGFIVIFFSDLIYGFVPDLAVGLIIVAGIVFNPTNLVIGLLAGTFFFAVRLISNFLAKKEAMGLGDITLAVAMGTALGWPRVGVAVWSGFLIGGVYATALLLLKKTKLSATIPLGPFLILGVIVSALWTEQIVALIL